MPKKYVRYQNMFILNQIDQFILIFILFISFIKQFNCETDYYLPSHYNFDICSDGFRVSIFSVEPFNGSSGFSIYFTDQLEASYYKLNVAFLNYNNLPEFSSISFAKLAKKDVSLAGNKTSLTIKRPIKLNNYQNTEIFFKEYFYFLRTENNKYVLGGYSNELISCPQVLCLNSYLDAAFYHEKESKFYFFRGSYYYSWRLDLNSSEKNQKFDPEFNLIETKFFNVPMHIDSATYFETNFYKSGYILIFCKEDLVFVFNEQSNVALIETQLDFFPVSKATSAKTEYINSITDLANGNLMISKQNSFTVYKVNHKSYSTKRLTFELINDQSFAIVTSVSFIELADDSITVKQNNVVSFISKWKVYNINLNYLKSKLDGFLNGTVDKVLIDEKETKKDLFYQYFNCNYSYVDNLKIIEEEDFKKIYLESLPNPHDPSLWYKLATSITIYDPYLVFVSIGVLTAFLTIAYILFFIFLSIFFTTRKQNGETKDEYSKYYESKKPSYSTPSTASKSESRYSKSDSRYQEPSTYASNLKKMVKLNKASKRYLSTKSVKSTETAEQIKSTKSVEKSKESKSKIKKQIKADNRPTYSNFLVDPAFSQDLAASPTKASEFISKQISKKN